MDFGAGSGDLGYLIKKNFNHIQLHSFENDQFSSMSQMADKADWSMKIGVLRGFEVDKPIFKNILSPTFFPAKWAFLSLQ